VAHWSKVSNPYLCTIADGSLPSRAVTSFITIYPAHNPKISLGVCSSFFQLQRQALLHSQSDWSW
jgi:hypothetical protein